MRRLLYIPIVHTAADLGSLATAVSQQTVALLGEERWKWHKGVAERFWKSVASYLLSLEPAALRIYQDGLAAEGDEGLRVVEVAAKRDSPNYLLLLELVHRGAVLRKTEDPVLLLKERQNLLEAIEKPSKGTSSSEFYRGQRDQLMEARDRFIAKTINETLREGEIGILFLGALHKMLTHLTSDIQVQQVASQEKVRAYFSALLSEVDEGRLQGLANDLIRSTRA